MVVLLRMPRHIQTVGGIGGDRGIRGIQRQPGAAGAQDDTYSNPPNAVH